MSVYVTFVDDEKLSTAWTERLFNLVAYIRHYAIPALDIFYSSSQHL